MEPRPFLVEGDSETARLLRSKDWSATRLGPMEQWPQSLRTSLSICVACRFPILVWWGPDRIMLYNDEYIPVLGSKHPAAMGGVGKDVWGDVWPVVGPMLDSVNSSGQAVKAEDLMLLMNRHGYDEEAYFSFSYSPIADESGGIGGIFTPVIETTEKVIGHRRIDKLRTLASRPRANSLQDACDSFAAVMADAQADVPFGLLYAIDAAGEANLACSFGLGEDSAAAPASIRAGGPAAPWPVLAAAQAAEAVVVAAPQDAGLPRGVWGAPCREAVVTPIMVPGHEHAVAVLVTGASPHRALDDGYLSFFNLLADQLQTGIGEALAYEAERKRVEALADIDRAKTSFFSNVSHEFRTPLTLMLGPLQEVLADPALDKDNWRHLDLVRRNGVRLLKLVNALLDFSRIEAGRMVAAFEPVDLDGMTAELAGVFRSAVERAGLAFSVECEALPDTVFVDRVMWEKVVLNLLSNAFKFTFEGGIALRLRAHDGRAELTVSDSGVGIDAANLQRVFERFHRVEGARSRSHEGSGIGLALVRDLVQMHGGEASIASRLGHGTTVTVTLPFGRAHLPPEHVALEPIPQHSSDSLVEAYVDEADLWLAPGGAVADPQAAAHARRGTVFVVDDNADMRDYLTRLLAPLHVVRGFVHGGELLDAARSWRPDLVLSDVMMPVMGGYEMLAALRQDADLSGVPVLLLSARAGEDERIAAERAGADGYLEKPFSSRELLAKVDALLLRARLHDIEAAHTRSMNAVFEQVPAPIALLRGPEHVYELANPEYRKLVGNRDLLHRRVRDALPELSAEILGLLDHAYQTGDTYLGRAVRVDLVRGDPPQPEESYFDVVYQPMRDAAGRVDGVAVVAFEVTEAVRATRIAEAANRSKDEFLAMLGHELRNPLAPIMSALEVMRLRGVDNLRREHGIIERQARHLVGLVDDLLDVARVAEGKIALRREWAELHEVVTLAVETTAPLLEERSHPLRLDLPREGLMLFVDRQRMSQVIANLLTNAAKYSDRGSPIRIAGRRDGDAVVLEVHDSGQGIAPDLLPRVFDMFYQNPQNLARSRGGLGLGLTIVRSLAELHGGSVSATSSGRGRGAVFTVRLPAAGATAQAPAGEDTAAAAAGEAAGRILVVDDNVDAATTLAELLRAYGHDVETAFDAPTALDKLRCFWPSLAILDIGLPGMDGYALAARMRELAVGQPLRLVALTGYGQADDRARALAAGFDRHMTKPVDFDQLLAVVVEHGAAGEGLMQTQ